MQLRGKTSFLLLLSILFLCTALNLPALFAGPSLVQSQPPASQQQKKDEVDTPYTEEEYAAYEKAVNEPDLMKRKQAIAAFTAANPKSALLSYVTPVYLQLMQQLLKNALDGKKFQELADLSEEYLKAYPNDLLGTAMAAEAYRELKNYPKFIDYGQKVFTAKPDPAIAYYLTMAYEATKDNVKYMEWALKTMSLSPDNIAYQLEFIPKLSKIHTDQKQLDKAAVLQQKMLVALDKATKPATTSDAEWKDYLSREKGRAWQVIGENLFQKDKWQESINAYTKAATFIKKNDFAYFRIGTCHWRLNDPDSAIENFARAYVINGEVAKSSYEYLEKLYKSIHNQSTVGINKVLDEAKKELGVK